MKILKAGLGFEQTHLCPQPLIILMFLNNRSSHISTTKFLLAALIYPKQRRLFVPKG